MAHPSNQLAEFDSIEMSLPSIDDAQPGAVRNVVRRGRGPRKRHWCFTSYLPILEQKFDDKVVRYCVYQQEKCPDTGKLHFQGYIEFFDCLRRGQVKKILGPCHLEIRQGSRTEAREYCRKPQTQIEGTLIEFGDWREDITRKRKLCDMLKTDMTLEQLIEESPIDYVRYHRGLHRLYARRAQKLASIFRKLTVLVLIGPTGCGKTRRANAYPDHYFLPVGDKLWFDNYQGQTCLIIDDFYGNIKYGTLLRILDGYELQVPYKGGFTFAAWTTVIITSNQEPDAWYLRGFTPALKRRVTEVIHMEVIDKQPPMSFVDLTD